MATHEAKTRRWTRLEYDRARAGIDDYWIVNLADRVLESYREPVPEPAAPFGWRSRSSTTIGSGGWAAPPAARGARIFVSDLLP